MAAPDMKIAGLQNVFLPALLQSLLSEICSRVVQALAHSSCVLEDSSSNSMTSCVHHPAETRPGDISSKLTEECTARRLASNFDEEIDSSEKCRVSILDKVATPDRADKAPRQQFSEWLLVAKNKDDEDEDDDEDDDDDEDEDDEDEDEDDEEGDDEEGDDEVGGHAEGEKGDGDKDEEEDEADDDDEEEEEEEEEEDEDDDEDEEDESPPKKLRK